VRDGVDKAVNAKVVFYTPLFESTINSERGILRWDRSERVVVHVPDILWETTEPQVAENNPIGLFIILALFGGVVGSAAADKKKLALILSVFCIAMFFGEYGFQISSITEQAVLFVSSVFSNQTGDWLNTDILKWGTIWEELDYSPTVDDETTEEVSDVVPTEATHNDFTLSTITSDDIVLEWDSFETVSVIQNLDVIWDQSARVMYFDARSQLIDDGYSFGELFTNVRDFEGKKKPVDVVPSEKGGIGYQTTKAALEAEEAFWAGDAENSLYPPKVSTNPRTPPGPAYQDAQPD
jgi:hypothetical protein